MDQRFIGLVRGGSRSSSRWPRGSRSGSTPRRATSRPRTTGPGRPNGSFPQPSGKQRPRADIPCAWRRRSASASTPQSSAFPSSGSGRATTPTRTSTTPRRCSRRRATTRTWSCRCSRRSDSVLGGIDEAIAVLQRVLGPARRRTGAGSPGWDELEVRALHEGDAIAPVRDGDDDRGRLRAVRPPRDRLPRLPGPALADHAQRARGRRRGARQADLLLPRPPRPLARADRRRLGRPRRRARSACPPTRRPRGGAAAASAPCRTPSSPPTAATRSRRRAASPSASRDEMNVTVLVDFENDSVETAARTWPTRWATACGACGWTPRSSSSTARCWTRWATSARPASTSGWCEKVRAALDDAGHPGVRIVVSGGFDAEPDPGVRGRAASRSTPTASARR